MQIYLFMRSQTVSSFISLVCFNVNFPYLMFFYSFKENFIVYLKQMVTTAGTVPCMAKGMVGEMSI